MEFEVEVKVEAWVARVRGTEGDVKANARKLVQILEEAKGSEPGGHTAPIAAITDAPTVAARSIGRINLSDAVLITLAAYDNAPLTKENLSERLKKLGKTFSQVTLDNKTIPLMCRKGLLHYTEVKSESSRGQLPRAYFLTGRGKLEAERILQNLANSIPAVYGKSTQ